MTFHEEEIAEGKTKDKWIGKIRKRGKNGGRVISGLLGIDRGEK